MAARKSRIRTLTHRTRLAVASLVAGAVMAACSDARTPGTPDDRAAMLMSERSMQALEARARGGAALTDAELVAVGYLERLRLGLGSPFRLADAALRDARLGAPARRAVAWTVLARTARGDAYLVDSTALADAPADSLALATAGRQRRLIDGTVATATTPRTGELAVRIAYALGGAEGIVGDRAAGSAAAAAAQARDRRLAMDDARRLLAAAGRTGPDATERVTALTLLRRWRAERRLAVERPLLADELRPDPAAAVAASERVLAGLRTIAATAAQERREALAAAPDTAPPAESTVTARADSADVAALRAVAAPMPAELAGRWAALPSVRSAVPQPAIVVTLGGYRRDSDTTDAASRPAHADARDAADRAARRRLVGNATSEEALAAEWTLARATLPPAAPARPELAARTLAAAVALRPLAQELPFATVDSAPLPSDLRTRWGLRRVTFDRTLSPQWRAAALLSLDRAMADLRGALPAVLFDDLAIHVGESVKRDSALALHDPATRTIYLPATTAAGTLAHELAHDLDWQAARTQLAIRGAYATDRAALAPRSTSIGRAVHGLAAARQRTARPLATPAPSRLSGTDRPAELFARGVDWYVAAALARDGRLDGALSAVQDELLPGYAGVTPPEPGDGTAEALVALLGDLTPLPVTTRDWFVARWGMAAATTPATIVRAALDAPPRWGEDRQLRALGLLPTGSDVARVPAGTCPAPAWQPRLIWLAADARARGQLRARALRWLAPTRSSWEARATLGAPWRPEYGEEALGHARNAILRSAAAADRTRNPFAPRIAPLATTCLGGRG